MLLRAVLLRVHLLVLLLALRELLLLLLEMLLPLLLQMHQLLLVLLPPVRRCGNGVRCRSHLDVGTVRRVRPVVAPERQVAFCDNTNLTIAISFAAY